MKLLTAFASLVLLASLQHASCLLPEESCTQVGDSLLRRLNTLRTEFNQVKNFFQDKDDELDILLLQDELLKDFKGQLGCQSVSEMIQFYLEEVLPKAEGSDQSIERHVDTIGNKLLDLRHTLKRCHRFLPCEKRSQTVKQIKETYKTLHKKGMYKAMGEFDIFIDYIEEYLMMKIGK
ncbi:interleukin-10 [Alligator mississippiensis]|uniref:interleukin-10 n=1 Tax=Alligator mississippiensis TaxID=8496 RepID=UPI00071159F1|nr:interleukin-10 [Alligator mississippiensis]